MLVARSFAVGLALLLAACGSQRSDEEAALGPEAPGVPHGPTHRPGQPCLVCHTDFSVAGTVYQKPDGATPADEVTVYLRDAAGAEATVVTNCVGNFYIKTNQFDPVFPLQASLIRNDRDPRSTSMASKIGRDGSCAGCHTKPASSNSPGVVYYLDASSTETWTVGECANRR